MATRDRTLLFCQYRNAFLSQRGGSASRTGILSDQTTGLLTSASQKHRRLSGTDDKNQDELGLNVEGIEMTTLPPRWLDHVEEIKERMESTRKQISQLEQLHKRSVLPGFDDSRQQEQSVESLSVQITQSIQGCQQKIKYIQQETSKPSCSVQERALGKNVQVALATTLQELSGRFRKSQSAYLAKLRGRDIKGQEMFANFVGTSTVDEAMNAVNPNGASFNMGFQEQQLAQMANNEAEIDQRTQEINDIAKSILQLADIFRDLQSMVIDQGTLLDRIDYNIETTAVQMKAAHTELVAGEKYQKKAQSKLCIMVLGVLVVILLIILMLKPRK